MESVEAVLRTVRVHEPEFRVERLAPGAASVRIGRPWALLAVARGRAGLGDAPDPPGPGKARGGPGPADATLGPGDALLTRDRDAVAAHAGDGGASVLVAGFDLRGGADRLAGLPADVVVHADSELCRPLIERLADGFDDGSAGGPRTDAVSARLLDWLVAGTVQDALRAAPGPLVADPIVSAALAAVHDDPAAPWTVAALARHAGTGRAAFARRFREATGTSPLSYVREHRLDLAERVLLGEPEATIAAVARRVGYAGPFSFSTAFRRHRGVSPSELRNPPDAAAPA